MGWKKPCLKGLSLWRDLDSVGKLERGPSKMILLFFSNLMSLFESKFNETIYEYLVFQK
jgi:hypothetical protein